LAFFEFFSENRTTAVVVKSSFCETRWVGGWVEHSLSFAPPYRHGRPTD